MKKHETIGSSLVIVDKEEKVFWRHKKRQTPRDLI